MCEPTAIDEPDGDDSSEELASYGGAGYSGSTEVVYRDLIRRDPAIRGVAADGPISLPRLENGDLGSIYKARVFVGNRKFRLSLGTGRQRALVLNVQARALLREGRTVAYVKAWLAAQLGAVNPVFPVLITVRQYVVAHTLLFPQLRRYRRALLLMVETVLRRRKNGSARLTTRPGPHLRKFPQSLSFPLASLDDALVAEYLAAHLSDLDVKDQAHGPASRSAACIVAEARACFAQSAWEALQQAGYPVLDLSKFRCATTYKPRSRTIMPLPPKRFEDAHAAVEGLRRVSRTAYFVGMLAHHAGFSSTAIYNAETKWLDREKGGIWCWPGIKGSERFVPLEPWVLDELGTAPAGYFAGRPTLHQRKALVNGVARHLRGFLKGWDGEPVQMPMQELVEQYTWFVIARHGEFRAPKILGVTYGNIRRYSQHATLERDQQKLWLQRPLLACAPELAPIVAFQL